MNIKATRGLFNDSPGVVKRESREGSKSKDANELNNLAALTLEYSKKELASYTEFRIDGISKASVPWMKKCSKVFWHATKGEVNKNNLSSLREHLIERYIDVYARRKVLNFAKAFLKYLSATRFDTRYRAFELFLEMPKGLKARKHVTSRIVTKADVENLLLAIRKAYENEEIDRHRYLNYQAIVLFGAFTGQRPLATIARLTVGQFRNAVCQEKPALDIQPEQDKIRMQHYCPLHPEVVDAMLQFLDSQPDGAALFEHLSFSRWLKQHKLRLLHSNAHFVLGDLRKFAEQHGDVIQWEQSNRAYVLTHGVSGIEWGHYRHPLPDSVYDIYMQYWGGVSLKT